VGGGKNERQNSPLGLKEEKETATNQGGKKMRTLKSSRKREKILKKRAHVKWKAGLNY